MSRMRSSSVLAAAVLCCLVIPVQAQKSFKERATDYAVHCKNTTVSLASRASSATKDYASRGAQKVSALAASAKDKAVVWGAQAKSFAKKRRVKQAAIGTGVFLIAGGIVYYFRGNICQSLNWSKEKVAAFWASLGIFGGAASVNKEDAPASITPEDTTRSIVSAEETQEAKPFMDQSLHELVDSGKEIVSDIADSGKEKIDQLKKRMRSYFDNISPETRERFADFVEEKDDADGF